MDYKTKIVKELYNKAYYKQITDLFFINIKTENYMNKSVINKIYMKDFVLYSLNAVYWNMNNPDKFYRISSEIKMSYKETDSYNIRKIRRILIENIYKQVIKKEIMMI